jgi:hypothetical protein
MSDTPETDAAVVAAGGDWSPVLRAVAQRLERERDEAREALRKAIRFVEAYEPHSRGVEADQNETLSIIRKVLKETK